jgi:hypothetical protein
MRGSASSLRSIRANATVCSPTSSKSPTRSPTVRRWPRNAWRSANSTRRCRHYEHVLSLPLGDDAVYALGKARAQFGLGHSQDTVTTLDDLRARWPDYQSAEGHLLYARALEDSGRTEDALAEYQAVATYYAGAEVRVRYGLLLEKTGRQAEAKTVLTEVLAQLKRAPKYVRRAQAEWIALAEKTLRS